MGNKRDKNNAEKRQPDEKRLEGYRRDKEHPNQQLAGACEVHGDSEMCKTPNRTRTRASYFHSAEKTNN